MNVIFNALYRMVKNGVAQVMPAPVDKDTPDASWEADRAAVLAPHLGRVGFTAFLWPPLTMSQGRSANNADGYGKNFDLNVGQWYPTRWGTAQQVLAANKALHAAGLMVLEDAVIHQYDGGNKQSYIELGSDGKPDVNLFPKTPTCFVPTVAVDPVFDLDGNMADGDMVSYDHCIPKGYMLAGVIQSMQWRRRRLALDGMRVDEAKGEDTKTAVAMATAVGGYNFAEVFSGSPDELERYVQQTGMVVLDFTFHWAAKACCEGGSFHTWVNNGLWARDSGHALLFADTADTDGNNSENIRFNKIWTYVMGLNLTAEGMLIYSADYLPERYGLGKWIDNLIWISRTFAYGKLAYQFVDDTFIVFTRDGDGGSVGWSGGLLVAINSDPINRRGEWVKTTFAPGTALHNYAPTYGFDTVVNQDGWAYIEADSNVNGAALSYVCYAPAGVNYQIPVKPLKHEPTGSLTDFSDITVKV